MTLILTFFAGAIFGSMLILQWVVTMMNHRLSRVERDQAAFELRRQDDHSDLVRLHRLFRRDMGLTPVSLHCGYCYILMDADHQHQLWCPDHPDRRRLSNDA